MPLPEAERKKRIAAGVQRWRVAMRKAGRCVDCGKKAVTKKNGEPASRCRRHLDWQYTV